MTFKQWNSVIMLVGVVIVAAWLVADIAAATGSTPKVAAVATRLLWAGLAMIVFNIVAAIGTAIAASIVTRAEFKDERADERDKAVYARSMRNAYFVVSVGGIITMLLLAFGYDPVAATYALFIGGLVAGAAGALSQLIYYRIG